IDALQRLERAGLEPGEVPGDLVHDGSRQSTVNSPQSGLPTPACRPSTVDSPSGGTLFARADAPLRRESHLTVSRQSTVHSLVCRLRPVDRRLSTHRQVGLSSEGRVCPCAPGWGAACTAGEDWLVLVDCGWALPSSR